MKKIILILLLIPLLISPVYAVGSSGSTGGESKVYAKSVKIEGNIGRVRIGDKITFKAKLDPSNASSEGMTWISSDSNILSIDNNGNAVAKNKGTVKVTVKTNNGKTDSIAVTVYLANTTSGGVKKVKTVSITSYPDEMIVGNNYQLQTKISPSLVDNNKLTFKSDNEKVLTVDSNGLVTAKKKGEATITVTSANNKTAKVTIKVVNAKVTLSKSSMTINEGETKEITVKIESNKQYSVSDLKWATGNVKITSVKTVSGGSNTFKAKVSGLSKGAAWISANIDGEKDRAKITVKEVGRDTSLECPLISYDTSDNEYIKINITPASTTDHFDYAVSTNKTSGENAKWNTVNNKLKGNQTLTSKYTDAQGKIRIYGKEGTSRDCYTAPFDLDGSKKSGTEIGRVYNYDCPTFTSKIDKIANSKQYKIQYGDENYGIVDLNTGVSRVNITIKPEDKNNFQYVWYSNENGLVNSIRIGSKWKLFDSFNSSKIKTLSTSEDTYFLSQGLVLLVSYYGNVKTCYTEAYSPLNFKSMTTVNGTNIYVDSEFNETKIHSSEKLIDQIKQLPKYYMAAPNIFLLSGKSFNRIVNSSNPNSVGLTINNTGDIYINTDHTSMFDIVHELAHSMDDMNFHINGTRLSEDNEIIKLYENYKNKTNNGSYQYLSSYAYTNQWEFWAELIKYNYYKDKNDYNDRLDAKLKSTNSNYISKIQNLYNKSNSDWNKYKDMYR